MDCFRRGQRKRFCAAGYESYAEGPLVIDVLRRSGIPRLEYEGVVSSWGIGIRMSGVMRDLWQSLSTQAELRRRTATSRGALALRRETLHFFDHSLGREKDGFRVLSLFLDLRRVACSDLRSLVEKHPKLVSAKELARIKAAARAAYRDEEVFMDANKRLVAQREPPQKGMFLLDGRLGRFSVGECPASTDRRRAGVRRGAIVCTSPANRSPRHWAGLAISRPGLSAMP